MNKYGVISDIKRAFLQISIRPEDRNFVRFLWWEGDATTKIKIFRHPRVVFGLKSSPFLPAAVINYLLHTASEEYEDTANKLKTSCYVDNVVISLENEKSLEKFKQEAISIMLSGQLDLRGWITNAGDQDLNKKVGLLGLNWDLETDTLRCDFSEMFKDKELFETKRSILSAAHRIYDPIGFTSPISLYPKILLQEIWKTNSDWDEKLPEEVYNKFNSWIKQFSTVNEVVIPRWFGGKEKDKRNWSLHVFGDTSKVAYAGCVFLRIETTSKVEVHLVQAKSRVAPKKTLSIPRLELMSCLIACRLAAVVKKDMDLEEIPCYYWTDSMNALYWIKNDEAWGTFVWNRVAEIRELSNLEFWNHVPGSENPADLPSRGCSVKTLIDSHWWEGPKWMKLNKQDWPKVEIFHDETIISAERKKMTMCNISGMKKHTVTTSWISSYSNCYWKIVRMLSRVIRFVTNLKIANSERKFGYSHLKRKSGYLTVQEIKRTELLIAKLIQAETLQENSDVFCNLQTLENVDGILRMRTKILMRDDAIDFKTPVLLPHKHPLVDILIRSYHEDLMHAGTQIVMSNLREKYWIVKSRSAIRSVILDCKKCKRFTAKPQNTFPAPLPNDRVKDAAIFEVIGVDLSGPLYIKNRNKCWIVIFTCAVYRAIHLELVSAMSTEVFLEALRRFISRRGRPSIIYSDNGKNFVGADNYMNSLDWTKIQSETNIQKIEWKFNVPTGAWWGGFFERLIGLVKNILKRVLGKACLNYEELYTVLFECENILNSRPLIYISDEVKDLVPLTPNMFLKEIKVHSVTDLDILDSNAMNKRCKLRQKVLEDLKKRFRKEYLGQLILGKSGKNSRPIQIGDIVLIESDEQKRIDWPLGKVVELFPGKDNYVRVVCVKTINGTYLRPIQRLYLMELSAEECKLLKIGLAVSPIISIEDSVVSVI